MSAATDVLDKMIARADAAADDAWEASRTANAAHSCALAVLYELREARANVVDAEELARTATPPAAEGGE